MRQTNKQRIHAEMDRLKRTGVETFCSADVGNRLGIDARTFAMNIRHRDDVKVVSSVGGKPSEWRFVEVSK